jgi:hypothetical protein
LLTGNPFLGFAGGFAANEAFKGSEGTPVSTFANILLDPVNKLRLLQQSPKALGFTKEQARALSNAGVFSEAARVAKDLPETQISKGLLKQLFRGERKLIDFRGNAGLQIFGRKGLVTDKDAVKKFVEETPDRVIADLGDVGILVPLGKVGIDIGRFTGAEIFQETMDAGSFLFGQTVRKFPKAGEFTEKLLRPIDTFNGKAFDIVASPFRKAFTEEGVFKTSLIRYANRNADGIEDLNTPEGRQRFVDEGTKIFKKGVVGRQGMEDWINGMIKRDVLRDPQFASADFRKRVGERLIRDASVNKHILEEEATHLIPLNKELAPFIAAERKIEDLYQLVSEPLDKAGIATANRMLDELAQGAFAIGEKVVIPQDLALAIRHHVNDEAIEGLTQVGQQLGKVTTRLRKQQLAMNTRIQELTQIKTRGKKGSREVILAETEITAINKKLEKIEGAEKKMIKLTEDEIARLEKTKLPDGDTVQGKINKLIKKRGILSKQLEKLVQEKRITEAAKTREELTNITKKVNKLQSEIEGVGVKTSLINKINDVFKEQSEELAGKVTLAERKQEILSAIKNPAHVTGKASVVDMKTMVNGAKIYTPKMAKNLEVVISDSKGQLGKEGELLVADGMFRIASDPEGPEKMTKVVIRLMKTRDVNSFSRTYGRAIWEIMSEPDKETFKKILLPTLSDPNDAGELVTKFVERFAHGMNGRMISNNPIERGFMFRQLDKAHGVLRSARTMFSKGGFAEVSVQKHFDELIAGKNFFENAGKKFDSKTFEGDIRKLLFIEEGKPGAGNIKDTLGFREIMENLWQRLFEAGMIPEFAKLRANLHGIGWEPVTYLQKKKHQELVALSAPINVSINKRPQVGDRPMLDLISVIKQDEEMQKLLTDMQIVSKSDLRFLMGVKNLELFNTPGHAARKILIDIASSAEVKPFEVFETDVAVLLQNAIQENKNLEMVPVTRWIAENVGFKNETKSIEGLKNTVIRALDKVYFDNDKMDTLFQVIKGSKNSKNAAMVEEIRELIMESQSKPTIENFNFLFKRINELADSGTLDRGAIMTLNETIGQGIQLKDLAGQELIHGVMAGNRLFGDPKFMDQFLESGFKNVSKAEVNELRKQLDETAFRNADSIKSFEKVPELKALEGRLGPNFTIETFTSGRFVRPNAKSINEMVEYKARPGATQPEKALDGALIPAALKGVIDGVNIKVNEQMGLLGKAINKAVNGFTKVEREEIAEKTADGINKALGKDVLGEGSINMFERALGATNFTYFTNLFKAEAVFSPAFHIRNAVSAFTTNISFGLNAKDHVDSMAFLWRMSRYQRARALLGQDTLKRLPESRIKRLEKSANTPSEIDIDEFNEMKEMGIFTSAAGQGAEQVSATANPSFNPGSLNFLGYRWNMNVGQSVEDVVRVAAYRHARNNMGLPKEEARALVHALHFNYNLLSETERNVFKKIIPFYTYLRKALARDTRLFMERTGEFNKMAHLIDAAEKDVPPEESVEVAHYVRENMGVRFRVNENGRIEYLMLGGLIPAADLVARTVGPIDKEDMVQPSKVVRNIAVNFMQGLNPLLKVPFEQAIGDNGFSFYFNRPLQRYAGENGDWFGQPVPRRYLHIIQNIRFLNDLNKFSRVVRGLQGGVSPTRPDIPLPNTADEAIRDTLATFGGVKLLENANPAAQRFFQQILPIRKAKAILRREKKRGSENVEPALRNYLRALGKPDEEIENIIDRAINKK